jgi:hypothetical protein
MTVLFNAIRGIDQVVDLFKHQESGSQSTRTAQRLYIIAQACAFAFDGVASLYDFLDDPISTSLRMNEAGWRVVVVGTGCILPTSNETKKVNRLSCLTLCNLGIRFLLPQATAIRLTCSALEALIRLSWLYDRRQEFN